MTDKNDAPTVVAAKPSRGTGFVLAALISPFSVPLAMFVIWTAIALANGGGWSFDEMGMIFMFATIPPLVTMVIVGLPVAFLLRRMGWLNALTYCAFGCVMGALVMAAMLWFLVGDRQTSDALGWEAMIGGGIGLVVAIAFCLLARVPVLARPAEDA